MSRRQVPMDAFTRTLGAELNSARRRSHWTREHLRGSLTRRCELPLSVQTLASYELGTRQFTVGRLVQLCDTLGQAPDRLLRRVLDRLDRDASGRAQAVVIDLYALARNEDSRLRCLTRWAHVHIRAGERWMPIDRHALAALSTMSGLHPDVLTDALDTLQGPPTESEHHVV